MKILVTGGKGMLGRTLQRRFPGAVVADLPDCDILDGESFTSFVLDAKPDAVIHAAAMTDVDGCEANPGAAFRLNEEGSRNVAVAAVAAGCRLVAISTDYVFGGKPPCEPWAWKESDLPHPDTVYGRSKLAGERILTLIAPDAVIMRTAWLYGKGGPSFLHTMARLGSAPGEALKVVDDQTGNPTSADALADAISFVLGKPSIKGVVHATCEGQTTWYGFAREIKRLIPGFVRDVVPCATAEFPRPAPRPSNSALKKSVLNINGYRTPDWRKALEDFVSSGI